MKNPYSLNTAEPSIMWLDLNSAFATAEQQAHPSLRGKPLGVTNRISKECCIVAASYEAKARGVKVGCRRSEALALCPEMLLLETDPPKYHFIYQKLFNIMQDYTPKTKMKSIDEGIMDFHNTPYQASTKELVRIGHEIKARVRAEIGDYMTINVGIGTNRFLAKTAAGLHKPDGLDVITSSNLLEVYKTLKLEDLTGVARAFSARLRACNINTPLEFLAASETVLKKMVFKSICGTYWYQRLRGFEVDDFNTKLGMVGRQWVVHDPTNNEDYLRSCLHHLTETAALKLRHRKREARGVCVWLGFREGGTFNERKMYQTPCYTDQAIWKRVLELFNKRPKHATVKIMGVYLYQLEPAGRSQLSLLEDVIKADHLTKATDQINDIYGTFTIHSADSLTGTKNIKQKIPFGGTEYFNLLLKRQ